MAAPAFPAFHVTGAVQHFVLLPGATAPLFLGTCESAPTVQFTTASKPVMNDIIGGALPAQKVDQGEFARITCALNRFSQSTLNAINSLRYAGTLGREGRFSRGALRYGFQTFRLWQVFENYYAPGVQAIYPGLPPGYMWPQVELVDAQAARLGTGDQLFVLSLEAQPLFTGQASSTAVLPGEREFWLYSQNPADFPAAVQVPQ